MASDARGPWTIGEMAARSGLSADTLRYYEREGLLPLAHRTGGQRRYEPDDEVWITFVKALRASGLGITAIRRYVALFEAGAATLGTRRRMLEEHAVTIRRRIAELEATRDLVEAKARHLAAIDADTRADGGPEPLMIAAALPAICLREYANGPRRLRIRHTRRRTRRRQ
jgi:DNA-binding transcriptional MerR regulator